MGNHKALVCRHGQDYGRSSGRRDKTSKEEIRGQAMTGIDTKDFNGITVEQLKGDK